MTEKQGTNLWVVSEKIRAGEDVKPEIKSLLAKIGVRIKGTHNNNMVELVGPVDVMKPLKLLIGSKTVK